jgi:hypothetical protein
MLLEDALSQRIPTLADLRRLREQKKAHAHLGQLRRLLSEVHGCIGRLRAGASQGEQRVAELITEVY